MNGITASPLSLRVSGFDSVQMNLRTAKKHKILDHKVTEGERVAKFILYVNVDVNT